MGRVRLAAIATVFALVGVAVAQAPSAAALARTVDAHYNRLQSLEARYTERYRGIRRGQPNHLHASCVSRADSGRCVFDY